MSLLRVFRQTLQMRSIARVHMLGTIVVSLVILFSLTNFQIRRVTKITELNANQVPHETETMDICYKKLSHQVHQPRCGDLPTHYPDSIPPLVHWTSKNGSVPSPLIPLVKSWHLLMSVWPTSWRFMHWDDNQIAELIKTHYPQLVTSYSKLVNGLERSDIGRLVVLHHVGGVYVDMDVELRRDLSPLLKPSQHQFSNDSTSPADCCTAIMSQEPIEHAAVFDQNRLISNAVILSRANHSFLSYFLREWPRYFQATWAKNVTRKHKVAVFVTGPVVLHQFYERYLSLEPANRPSDWSGTFLAEPDVFQPIWDRHNIPNIMKKRCAKPLSQLSQIWKNVCLRHIPTKFETKPAPTDSFTDHRFMHLSYTHEMDMKNSRNIDDLLPLLKCTI